MDRLMDERDRELHRLRRESEVLKVHVLSRMAILDRMCVVRNRLVAGVVGLFFLLSIVSGVLASSLRRIDVLRGQNLELQARCTDFDRAIEEALEDENKYLKSESACAVVDGGVVRRRANYSRKVYP